MKKTSFGWLSEHTDGPGIGCFLGVVRTVLDLDVDNGMIVVEYLAVGISVEVNWVVGRALVVGSVMAIGVAFESSALLSVVIWMVVSGWFVLSFVIDWVKTAVSVVPISGSMVAKETPDPSKETPDPSFVIVDTDSLVLDSGVEE